MRACVSFNFIFVYIFLYHFHLVQFIALQMLPFQKFAKQPDDAHIRDDADLVVHGVKLMRCCKAMDECEDVVLHCCLHGEKIKPPTIMDEHQLWQRVAMFVLDWTDAESHA